jgi:uncharacterized membrane protein
MNLNGLLHMQLDQNVSRTGRIISALAGGLLLLHGMRRGKKFSEIPLGSYLLFRGATGYCPVNDKVLGKNSITTGNGHAITQPGRISIDTRVMIDKSASQVYKFWRKLENLPSFMKHLEQVNVIDETTSIWKAKIPGGFGTIEWESEIIEDLPNQLLAWRSMADSEIMNSGKVEFIDTGSNQSELHAVISYEAPGGIVGEKVSRLLNPIIEKMIKSDIENFKSYIEAKKSTTKKTTNGI